MLEGAPSLCRRASSTSATAVINVTTDAVQIQDNGNDLEEEGGEYFVDIEPDELDLSGLLRRLLRQLLRRLLRLQLRLNHESEAARRAQRTKSSGRGGRRLLVVVVILRQLAAKKASMPTVHRFKGFMIAQMYRL
ncbi:hypothetical protein V8E54_003964 [Elaphomyces granulatus]